MTAGLLLIANLVGYSSHPCTQIMQLNMLVHSGLVKFQILAMLCLKAVVKNAVDPSSVLNECRIHLVCYCGTHSCVHLNYHGSVQWLHTSTGHFDMCTMSTNNLLTPMNTMHYSIMSTFQSIKFFFWDYHGLAVTSGEPSFHLLFDYLK